MPTSPDEEPDLGGFLTWDDRVVRMEERREDVQHYVAARAALGRGWLATGGPR